jgi:hypothetical protein
MTWQSCTAKGSCTSKSGKITIDANWRWLHQKSGQGTHGIMIMTTTYKIAQYYQLLHGQRMGCNSLSRQQGMCCQLRR